MKISIRKEETRKLGDKIIEDSVQFGEDIKKFSNIIDSINTVWDGADALKYINMMREKYLPDMNELKDLLEEYGNYLKNAPEAYSIVEEIFSERKIDI